MRIVRFDDEVSIPVTAHGSDFRIGPLTGDGSRVRVQVLHVPPGGRIGRHPAAARQLLGVVAGTGWARGGDGGTRPLAPGQGAVWEPGEEHDAGTDEGFTAICVEGAFDVWALSVTRDIVVADYDPAWPDWFRQVHDRVWPAVADVALRIDHVGSTAVPGLAAKPIIDLDVVVASEDGIEPVKQRLRGVGYRWRGDLGVTGREAFKPVVEDDGLPPHHLYLVVEDNKAHLDHWLLRDVLRDDADARDRYAELKRRNAERAGGDMDVYVKAKARFVAELLRRARAERGLPPAEYWDPDLPDDLDG